MTENNENNENNGLDVLEEKNPNPDLRWYVINTYSGQENRAVMGLEERIKQQGLEDYFGEILVPSEKVEEIRGGVKKTMTKKCFPGYMLAQMVMGEEVWQLVKNTPKITGFVGGSKKPLPLRQREVDKLLNMSAEDAKPRTLVEFSEGETIKVIDGAFASFSGVIEEVKPEKEKLRALVSIFGRSTPVELDFTQVEKVG